MVGTILNAAGIVIGGIAGLTRKTPIEASSQSALKLAMGGFTFFFGLKLTWMSVNGSFLLILKQLAVVILALTLGRLTGRVLHLQKMSNAVGQFATKRIAAVPSGQKGSFNDGFIVASALYLAGPLAVLGTVPDGLIDYPLALITKAMMDGLATMFFVQMFGWSAMLAVLPVVAYQGTWTLLARGLAPGLRDLGLIDPINATAGLLIFCTAMIIFEVKKFELADYLPSLAWAPFIAWLWR